MVLTGNTGNNYNQVDTRNLMNECPITQFPYDMQPGSVLTEPFFSSNSLMYFFAAIAKCSLND